MASRRPKVPPAQAGPPDRDMGRPSFADRAPLELVEIVPPPRLESRFLGVSPRVLRVYKLGGCSVIVTREFERWHLSISHPNRYPHWDEIAEAKYRILPRVVMALPLPDPELYVNFNPHCFQLIEVKEPGWPE